MAEGERVELYAILCTRGLTVPRTGASPATPSTTARLVLYIRQIHTHVNQKTNDGAEMSDAFGIRDEISRAPGLCMSDAALCNRVSSPQLTEIIP